MTDDLQIHKTPDGYELRSADCLLGALIWATRPATERPSPGWWLEILGCPPELVSEVPVELVGDLEAARAATDSASLGFAELLVADRLAGQLDPV
jgi:hypothetical protein